MFFLLKLEKNLQLHPRFFGRGLRQKLEEKLKEEVEGTCTGRHGFIVCVERVLATGTGMIRDGTGYVSFPVKYEAVVFRPFKGEVLEAVVTIVNKMGFFAEAGPVQIFVSSHLIPENMKFTTGDVNCYLQVEGTLKIQKDSEVLLRVVGTRVDATEIFCIGTIKDNFLGLNPNMEIA